MRTVILWLLALRCDPHKTNIDDQTALDRSVDLDRRICKVISGNY